MDVLREEILDICKSFMEVMDMLYEKQQITYEQYVEMSKLKIEYIKEMTNK